MLRAAAIPLALTQAEGRTSDSPTCNLTSWSGDGFGHQLAAAIACKLLSVSEPKYQYFPSEHFELEHTPAEPDALSGFLNTLFLPSGTAPAKVPFGRYHPTCDGGANYKRHPPCSPGKPTICDNCYRMVPLGEARTREASNHVIQSFRSHLSISHMMHTMSSHPHLRNATPGRERCHHRAAVCVHQRGVGKIGHFPGRKHTPQWAEVDSVRRRSYPAEWWLRGVRTALAEYEHAGRQASKVVVHTNDVGLANRTFGEMLDGQRFGRPDISLHVSGPDVSLIEMMHQMVFCCHTLLVGRSSLSSVISYATMAESTFSSYKADEHLPFTYRVIPRTASKR
jgi:hypothetical protein